VTVDSDPTTRLYDLYRWMLLSRVLEAECARRNSRWFPAEGEEATIVGGFFGLRADDAVAPHYRGPFAVYALRGAELWRLACQALGRAGGYARGRAVPFTGPFALNVVPWVAGDLGTSIGVGTGAALAFAYEGSDRVAVISLGDGTVNRGDFAESLNLAACWKLPVVYVVQHNGWAISEPSASYLPAPVADRAAGYGLPGEQVDGNDVLAVHAAVQRAVARARAGLGPSLIEAKTYRLGGHWAADAAGYRPAAELTAWRARDPLPRAERLLQKRGLASASELTALQKAVAAEVAVAFARAENSPAPCESDLGLDEVFAR
jgi:TPP-dependent pyruvate/acetoin dehydrogenase alpha subunit